MTVSTHVYTVTVGGEDLELVGGRISLDSSRVPHVQATIEVATPGAWAAASVPNPLGPGTVTVPVWTPAPEIIDALDPRSSPAPRVVITASQDGGAARTFDLHIRDRSINHRTGRVSLDLASDEALLEDYAPLADDDGAFAWAYAPALLVEYVLGTAIPGAFVYLSPPFTPDLIPRWAVTNRVLNPSAASTSGFTLGGNAASLATSTTSPKHGAACIRWDATTASTNSFLRIELSDKRVTPGKTITLKGSMRASVAGVGNMHLQYRDEAGQVNGYASGPELAVSASGWVDMVLISTPPAGAVTATAWAVGRSSTAGARFYLDEIMHYDGRHDVEFFTGDTPDDANYTYEWSGAASASPSSRTPITELSPDALVWKAGQSAIDFLHPLLQSRGLRLVCDETRMWTLRDELFTTDDLYGPDVSLTFRHGVNLIEARESIGRGDGFWFDGRVVRYTWTDEDGIQQTRVDSYALSASPSRVSLLEVAAPFPGPGRAEYTVRRAQGVGRMVSIESVADWAAMADMPLFLTVEDTPPLFGTSLAVSFDLDTDRMTVTTRARDIGDEHAWILQAAGAWTSGAVGESWTEA